MVNKDNYHHGDLRSALIEAGEQVLSEHGLTGFTLRACAKRAGVSHSAPKHHFGGMKGLLTAIAAMGYERLADRLRHELAQADSLEDEFYATIHAYVGFAQGHPEHFRIMFRADMIDMQEPRLMATSAVVFTELTNVILRQRGEAETTEKEVTDGDIVRSVGEDIVIGWSHIHGFAHLMLEDQMGRPTDEERHQMMSSAAGRLSRLLQNS